LQCIQYLPILTLQLTDKEYSHLQTIKHRKPIMPSKPKKPCRYPGCPNLTHNTYCEAHAKLLANRYEKSRPSASQRGYDYRWRKYSKYFLQIHPLCVNFAECHNVAVLVDHIKPHKGNSVLFWDPENHQAMCKPCHDRKTASEDGGFGNTKGI